MLGASASSLEIKINNQKIKTTMSKKNNARRAAYQARQEKEGKKVVNWIFGALIFLAICFVIYSVWIMM